jgi:glycosyltransferase involved in cell wall biosynthesis
LLQNHPLPRLKLICTGHQTEYFNYLKALRTELQLEDKVEFKGVVSDAELKRLYKECLGVVVPTKYEAGSFPLMEAIAQTIPVICSNTTSLPDTIKDERFVFDPDDVTGMSKMMKQLILNEQYRKSNIYNSKVIRDSVVNQKIDLHLEKLLSKLSSEVRS